MADSGAKPETAGAEPDPGEELKRKFREALERKRAQHTDGTGERGSGTGRIHGRQGPAASRRSFRRKSGG